MTALSELHRSPLAEERGTPGRIGLWLTYGAALAAPWNGLRLAGLKPGDMLLLLAFFALCLSAMGRTWPTLPGWMVQFGAVIFLVTALHEIKPTDERFLTHRLVVDSAGRRIGEAYTNLGVGLKFLVVAIVMPLVFALARTFREGAIRRCAWLYAAGTAVSSVVAYTDSTGITSFWTSLTHVQPGDGRSGGLTNHPNFLGITCVISTPILLWFAARSVGRDRVVAIVMLLAVALGVYSSGSRGGAAVLVVTVVLSCVVMPEYRRALPLVAFLGTATVVGVFVAMPSVGAGLLDTVRLGSNDSTASGSDFVRSEVQHQGWLDFTHSPFDGIGLQVAAQAHDVYLQALASGGILLLLGFVTVLLGALSRAVAVRRTQPLANPLLVAVVAVMLMSAVENGLTDRLVYVPIALLAAMPAASAGWLTPSGHSSR